MSNRKSASFHQNAKALIKRIPRGKVATYGQIAALAGQPRAARQVAWVLHTASEKDGLPWHRVINSQGTISLPRMAGYEVQRALLKKEGIKFDRNDCIDLARFQWRSRGKKKVKRN
jgi:methylated-DNA-protein-cysteine methyltransferase-like protein